MRRVQIRHIVAAAGFMLALSVSTPAFADTQNCGYIADDIEVPSAENGISSQQTRRAKAARTSEIPDSYDARTLGYVTSVKNQQDNTCWAYSAISMAESDLISGKDEVAGRVLTKDTADFSEDHLVYAFYHNGGTTPLGWYRGVGGNHIFTTFGFANWIGLAEETQTGGIDWENEVVDLSQISQSVHMQNAYWINLKQNPNLVKRMILQHGSAAISMYYAGYYMNQTNAAYYNDGAASVNHAVAIIGWDDNYPAANFKTNPGIDGAWLAKNSYGTDTAGEGYFWISYQDAALNSNTAKAFVFDFEPAGQYDYIYQYDKTAGAYMEKGAGDTGYRVQSGKSIANVFSVPADTKTGCQTLEAVSMALFAVNVDYSVQIYKNPADAANPVSGTPLLAEPVVGKTSYVGYYTIPLNQSLQLQAGDTFSVVITLSKSSGGAVSYFVDKTYQNGNWISFEHEAKAGQSFEQTDSGWQDLAESGATARIKAFTSDYVIPTEGVQLDCTSVTLWKGQSRELAATITPETASYRSPQWSSSDSAVAAVDENGCVTAVAEGTAVITASAKDNPAVLTECTVTVRQQVEQIQFAGEGSYECKAGGTVKPEYQVIPENALMESISFASLNETIAMVDADGTIHGKKQGTAGITVTSCVTQQVLASFEVSVLSAKQENPTEEQSTSEQPVLPEQEETVTATGSGIAKTDDNSGIALWLGIGAVMLILMGITTRASSR